jgi:signal transduction histidine kinase
LWRSTIKLTLHEIRHYWDRKVFTSLAAIILVTLAATVFIIFSLNRELVIRQQSIQVTKAQTVADQYFTLLLNAETGQRGYLLTGNPDYLKPYQTAAAKVPAEGRELVALSAPYSYSTVATGMTQLATAKLSELALTIKLYQEQGQAAALAVVTSDEGQTDMDRLRSMFDSISSQQSSMLAAKRAQATLYGQWATWASESLIVITILLAGLVYYLFIQAIKGERSLDEAKAEFVSLASHQLRTPASSIRSYLSLMASGDLGPLTDRQQRMVDHAIESNSREIRIIEQLLDVARADAGRLVLNVGRTDIRKVIRDILDEHAQLADSRHQQLQFDGPKHSVWINGDADKLYMAIGNIVDNALKYTDEGGEIKVKLIESPSAVMVQVQDNGMGMEKAETAAIFDRFERTPSAVSKHTNGSGLGLYLARQIALLHKGTINVSSVKGAGSTFTFVIPKSVTGHAA